ncbi:MAG: ABC transporter permease, partial [Cyclobacteriaceae bacterium]|nr:ABC transporter permease [Cyclobacteriaceae bacterium]
SGGQRKRLNIGLELMREPSVLYVDEPTSGLSSRDSENIMDLLKELSFRGKMVFVVIHQPSSDIFKMFDNLVIMDVGGFQIFYGNPVESVTYFKNIVNAANKDQGACMECGNINSEQVFNIIETRIVNEFGRHTDIRKISPQQWYQYYKDNIKLKPVKQIKEGIKSVTKIPSRMSQWVTYFIRDVKTKLANDQYMAINLFQAPVLAIFIGVMVRYYNAFKGDNPTYNFAENDNIPVYFFMSIIVALFMGLTVSAEEIFRDRMMLKRERFLNLSRFSYLTSKITILFIISAIQTVSFAFIGDVILGIEGIEPRFWVILFSISCFANMLGLNISSSFNSAVTIYIIIPLLLIPQLLLSGVVINFDKFNPAFSTVKSVPLFGDLMASRWAFEAAMVTQFKDNPFEKPFFQINKRMADIEFKQIYYFPTLESELEYCFNNLDKRSFSEINAKMKRSIDLVKDELLKEYYYLQHEPPQSLVELNFNKFNAEVYFETKRTIEILKKVYAKRFSKVETEKLKLIERWNENGINYDSMKGLYQNLEIAEIVKNSRSLLRIVKQDKRLTRKYNPIYNTSHIDHSWNYRADFYTPVKQFFGYIWDTLYFNIFVIWFMSFVLFFTLYFDGLKQFLSLFRKKKQRKNRNKNFI